VRLAAMITPSSNQCVVSGVPSPHMGAWNGSLPSTCGTCRKALVAVATTVRPVEPVESAESEASVESDESDEIASHSSMIESEFEFDLDSSFSDLERSIHYE
jgi:hypothetical protein